jgi:hypothetical protein
VARYENAVVFEGGRVLSPGGLRHGDEPVRHKMLDALGDLALAGGPVLGRYTGVRAGHALTNRLLREVFAILRRMNGRTAPTRRSASCPAWAIWFCPIFPAWRMTAALPIWPPIRVKGVLRPGFFCARTGRTTPKGGQAKDVEVSGPWQAAGRAHVFSGLALCLIILVGCGAGQQREAPLDTLEADSHLQACRVCARE